MENEENSCDILIYQSVDGSIKVDVQLVDESVWLTQGQMAQLFKKDKRTISEHIGNIFKDGELQKDSVVRNFRTTADDGKSYDMNYYNLDVIISTGYRVKSRQGIHFRIWATQRLKDYLVQGYAINEKRLQEKQQEVEYLKTGIRIVSRAIEAAANTQDREVFQLFSHGLALLDDYDHEELDRKGKTRQKAIYPDYNDYMNLIENMYSDFKSDVFARPKDESFKSSIGQMRQKFDGKELYPTIEEKAANLLYFITKNHSFVDGNKRIAAACFLYFLEQNKALMKEDGALLIDNNTLAALTLFIAASKPDEADIVKRLIISILNRNKQ